MVKIADSEICPCGSGKTFGECHGERIRQARLQPSENRIVLELIAPPDPNTRSVFEKTGEGAIFLDGLDGPDELVCGNCRALLAVHVIRDSIHRVVFRCKDCGAY